MAERTCVKRLQKEFRILCEEPLSNIVARPSPNNILEWHYVLEGSKDTPFEGGFYYGKIKFPSDYPYKPPGISMITPNGRFATQKKICLSMSDYHPETWNPVWSVSSILTGLLSFMNDDSPTAGSITTTADEKKRLAIASLEHNCKLPVFRAQFPEFVEKYNQQYTVDLQRDVEKALSRWGSFKSDPQAAGGEPADLEGADVEETALEERERQPIRKFLFWLLFLLACFFGATLPLPFLQP